MPTITAEADDSDLEKDHQADEETETNKDDDDGVTGGTEKKKRRRKRKRKRKSAQDDDDDEDKQTNEDNENTTTILSSIDEQRAAECDRTVFVEGIPYNATEQDVRDFFQEHGGLTDIIDCRLPVWQDSGRLRGYGHVVFSSVSSQQEALTHNGKYLKNSNRYLNIQAAKRPRDVQQQQQQAGANANSEPSKTILLNNLSYDATEEDIEAVLEKYGTISKGGVRVVRNSVNQRSKGFAYCEFEDVSSATKVMKNRIIILNRPCRIDYDHGRIRGSFRTASGRLWQKEYGKPSMYGKRQRQSRQPSNQSSRHPSHDSTSR